MKTLILAGMLFALGAQAQVEFHGTSGAMTADLASYTAQQPNIPGMGKTENYLGISFSSTDTQPQFFRISVELEFADGTRYANPGSPVVLIQRAAKDPTVVKLYLGTK